MDEPLPPVPHQQFVGGDDRDYHDKFVNDHLEDLNDAVDVVKKLVEEDLSVTSAPNQHVQGQGQGQFYYQQPKQCVNNAVPASVQSPPTISNKSALNVGNSMMMMRMTNNKALPVSNGVLASSSDHFGVTGSLNSTLPGVVVADSVGNGAAPPPPPHLPQNHPSHMLNINNNNNNNKSNTYNSNKVRS